MIHILIGYHDISRKNGHNHRCPYHTCHTHLEYERRFPTSLTIKYTDGRTAFPNYNVPEKLATEYQCSRPQVL